MGKRCALTTVDNPYDPFDDFQLWLIFDTTNGYNSSDYLGRIARTSNLLTDQENDEEIERAIDEIISLDFLHIYKKVYEK